MSTAQGTAAADDAASTEAPAGAPPLEVRGASKSFGDTAAVADVSLDLRDGEIVALVGPSGCGKSTLLRLIAGLEHLDDGAIVVGGTTVDDGRRRAEPERRRVGLVFQDHALFPHLTVAANVGFGIRTGSRAERRAEVERLLDLVALGHLARRYPHEISGGERQRVSLARAIAPCPRLLLLDEPFASLDPNRRAQVRGDVVALLRATRTPAVLVTHDQAEALAVGDRVAVMADGRLQQVGDPVEVYAHPVNRFVAGFMGEARFLPVEAGADGPRTELGPTGAPLPDGHGPDAVLAVVRPADVVFEPDPDGDALVEAVEYRGAAWTYELRLASGATVLAGRARAVDAPPGTAVRATLAPGHPTPLVPVEG